MGTRGVSTRAPAPTPRRASRRTHIQSKGREPQSCGCVVAAECATMRTLKVHIVHQKPSVHVALASYVFEPMSID